MFSRASWSILSSSKLLLNGSEMPSEVLNLTASSSVGIGGGEPGWLSNATRCIEVSSDKGVAGSGDSGGGVCMRTRFTDDTRGSVPAVRLHVSTGRSPSWVCHRIIPASCTSNLPVRAEPLGGSDMGAGAFPSLFRRKGFPAMAVVSQHATHWHRKPVERHGRMAGSCADRHRSLRQCQSRRTPGFVNTKQSWVSFTMEEDLQWSYQPAKNRVLFIHFRLGELSDGFGDKTRA